MAPLTPCSVSPVDAKFVLGQEMKSALHKRFFKAFLAHFLTCFLPTTHEFSYSGVQKLCFIKDSKACIKFYYKQHRSENSFLYLVGESNSKINKKVLYLKQVDHSI